MTLILIAITCFVSWRAFNNPALRTRLMFIPSAVKQRGEYYRFLTHGFVHADFRHLLFNMYALYIFGEATQYVFTEGLFGVQFGNIGYLLFYLAALVASTIPDYLRHQDNSMYASLGASGGVSAVMWPYIMLAPWNWFIFPPVPAIVLGIGYIAYSHYADKRGTGNIGHNAHLSGAIFGLLAYVALCVVFNPYILEQFWTSLLQPQSPF